MAIMTTYQLLKPLHVLGQQVTEIEFRHPNLAFYQELAKYSTREQPVPTEFVWAGVALEHLATANGALLSRTTIDAIVAVPAQYINIMVHLLPFFLGLTPGGSESAPGDSPSDLGGPLTPSGS